MLKSFINRLAQTIAIATTSTGTVSATPEELAKVKTLTIPANIGTRKQMVGHTN